MAVGNNNDIEKRLWDAADQLRANSRLKSSEYSVPVLGLIFLRYADHKFSHAEKELQKLAIRESRRRGRNKADYQARGILYIPDEARYARLLKIPEGQNIGKAINEAMKAIEADNEELKGILPKDYNRLENDLLITLLKTFSEIPMDMEGDVFGKIYEYFLGRFAMAEGQRGGEFFTPISLVKLIVEVIEPYHGRILDPACGSAGMFVQSANFVKKRRKNPSAEISLYGQEKVAETIQLSRMSLAVHGLSGDIKQGNTYYEDAHRSVGKFDFVMANPPFNVDGVDKEKIKDDPRFKLGIPKKDNANFLWIQIFLSALNDIGRAGFVMANSAVDGEYEIRKKIVEGRSVDAIIYISNKFFYTVTVPCTLWFFDKGKKNTERKDKILFIDARHIFNQIDRAHREFTQEQISFIANIVRMYRGEPIDVTNGDEKMIKEKFPILQYLDIAGLCKVASLDDVREQGYSLNSGRYVGVAEREKEDFDFSERLEELNEELEKLDDEAGELHGRISKNVSKLLEEHKW